MIPSTLLGVALFVASLGPGYVYMRVAEKRRPRAERSGFGEIVEMVSIGVLTSLLAALVVVGIGRELGLLHADVVAKDLGRYFVLHPFRGFGSLALIFGLSYCCAALLAALVHRGESADLKPYATAWYEVFWEDRKARTDIAVVTAELRDGRKVTGILRSFTTELTDNREIALHEPIAVQASASSIPTPISDQFITLREDDCLYVAGRYLPGASGQ